MPQAIAAAAYWVGTTVATTLGAATLAVTGSIGAGVWVASSTSALLVGVSELALWAGMSYAVDVAMKPKLTPAGAELNFNMDPAYPREMIIGERLVGGSMAARYSRGSNLYNAHMVIQVADHPCTELSKVYDGGRVVWPVPLVHGVRTEIEAYSISGGARVWMTWHDGRAGQTADTDLITKSAQDPDVVAGKLPGWSSDHRGAGCAYIHVEVQWDSDILTSIPQFQFLVKGAPLYDRRKDSTAGGSGSHRLDDPSTWEYTDNAAVAADHYLLGYKVEDDDLAFGIGLHPSEVPYEIFANAADLADEDVETGTGDDVETIKRYVVNGVVSAADYFEDVLEAFQIQMAARFVDLGGRIGILGAEERAISLDLTDQDLVADDQMQFADKLSFDDLYGSVSGTFADPANLYQQTPYETQYTPYNALPDGGEAQQIQIALPYEVHPRRAVRNVSAWLKRESLQPRLIGIFMATAWALEPGDWFTFTSERLQLDMAKFEVIDIAKHDDFTVTITARAIDPEFLAFSVDDDPDLSVPPEVEPVSLVLDTPAFTPTATTISGGGATEPVIQVVTDAPNPVTRELVIEAQEWNGSALTGPVLFFVGHADSLTSILRQGLKPNTAYKVRMKARAGARESAWSAWSSPITTDSAYTVPVAGSAAAALAGSALEAAIAAAGASADADAAAAAASAAAAAAAQALAEAARDTATSAAGSAGTYSGEAQDARDDAVAAAAVAGTHADTADGHAATALAQASSATASASAASNSATLSATFAAGSQGSINSSATFADNANATGVPTNWADWGYGAADGVRVTGIAPQPYAYQQAGRANLDCGIYQGLSGRLSQGWHVVEADVTLDSGALTGAGAHINWGPASLTESVNLTFSTDLDITGVAPGAGTTGRLYKFRKLFKITDLPTFGNIYMMSHWSGHGAISSANLITWRRLAIRPASQAEIEARQAKTDLVTTNANVSANTLAISTESAARVLADNVLTARFVANQKNSQNMLRDSTFRATDRWTLNNGAVGQQVYLDHTYLWMPFGAHRSAYQDVRVQPGVRYAMSGDVYSDNDNEVRLYVLWLNEARDTAMGANSGYDGLFGNAGGASHPGWRHVTFDINNANVNGGYGLNPPIGTAWARVFVDNWPGDGTSGGAAARRLKFESGDYASAWSEDDGYLEALDVGADLAIANAEIATNAAASASNAASIASLTTTVSSNHTAVMAPSVNLIPYPSGTARTNPTGEGLSTTQQGWTVSGGSAGGGFVNGYWDPAGGAILYNMWAAGYSSGSDRYYYIDIPVTYWGWYTFAFDGYVSNLDATKVSYYVQALNGSNTWLGESATTAFSASPNGRRSVTFNAPSGTEKLRVAFRIQAHTSPSAGAYADLVMRALQLEHGQVATKFNEAGRIIAGERRIGLAEADISVTAATLATESAARALLETNLRAALGAGSDNLVINTDFYNGLEGWVTGWDGNSGLPVTRGFADTDSVGGSAGAYSGAVRTAYVRLTGTPAVDTVVDGYTTRAWANLADLKRWAVRVPGAVRVHASMYMSAHRGKARLIVGEFDATGTLINDANYWDGTANHNNFGSGNPANAERVGGFFTTNANTRYLVLVPRLVGVSGGNDPYLFYGWAMVAMASAQQTVPAPYVSGGLDRGIYGDVALNAGAIADVNGGAAWLEAVVSASGGDLGAFRLRAGKAGSFIELISTVLRLANVSNGAVIEVMRAIGGFAFFSNPVSIDVGGKRMTLGPGFGASSDLLFWFGPDTTAISAMTKTNGHWAWATDGETYKGTGALVDSTVNEQTKTGTANFDNIITSGTTATTMATIDLTVGASGYLELLSPLFFGPLSINQESGMTLSAGTDWFGQMIVTEQLQSGGSEYTLWTIPLQISDTGGGLFDFIFDPPVVKVVAQNVSGASRYRIKIQRTSGSNNVSGNGLQGKFTIRRTP